METTSGDSQRKSSGRPTRPGYPMNSIHRRVYNDIGHADELTFCCFHRYPFLSKDRTCEWLAESIIRACNNLNFSLWAFVFMPDHVHLIVHPNNPAFDVSKFLEQTKQPTSRRALAFLRKQSPLWLERLKRQRGDRTEYHFWQIGGGFDRNITEPETLERMIEYLHMNPVRKGLVKRAIDWKWSSATWFQSGAQHQFLPVAPIAHEWTVGMSDE